MIKTLERLKQENTPYGTYGVHYFNLETGVTPEIDDSAAIIGTLDCIKKITIEKNVFSGHDVMILTGCHDPYKYGEDRKKSDRAAPIHIKEGAWLGSRCIILKGVIIGKYSVVGAGSVVTHSIPDFEVWAGNPAKLIERRRYSHED